MRGRRFALFWRYVDRRRCRNVQSICAQQMFLSFHFLPFCCEKIQSWPKQTPVTSSGYETTFIFSSVSILVVNTLKVPQNSNPVLHSWTITKPTNQRKSHSSARKSSSRKITWLTCDPVLCSCQVPVKHQHLCCLCSRWEGFKEDWRSQSGQITMFSATVVLAGLVLALLWFFTVKTPKKHHLPPGPFAFPLVGNLPQIDKYAPFKSFMEVSLRTYFYVHSSQFYTFTGTYVAE